MEFNLRVDPLMCVGHVGAARAERTQMAEAAMKLETAAEFVPYQRNWRARNEEVYVRDALYSEKRQGGGPFTRRCHEALSAQLNAPVLLTQSCTAALEMAAALLDLAPGDEIVVPSYTFSSSAAAFVTHGARIVFVDIDPDTQNIDPQQIQAALTPRSRAVLAMHYAGVACDMAAIGAIAAPRGVAVIEDAAQAIGASAPDGRALGAIGALGALSFHDTKNVSSGEGGALILGNANFLQRAEIMWEKGTDRSRFLRGEIDKYTWVDKGASYLPSELTAALLLAQLEETEAINTARLVIWRRYQEGFAGLAREGRVRTPLVPEGAQHNAHLYYLITDSQAQRDALSTHLRARNIQGAMHYVPLHDSAAGLRYGRVVGPMTNSIRAGECLLRLPLWPGMSAQTVDRVIEAVNVFYAA